MSDVMAANPQHYSMGGFSYGTLCNATASPVPPSQMGVCELFNHRQRKNGYIYPPAKNHKKKPVGTFFQRVLKILSIIEQTDLPIFTFFSKILSDNQKFDLSDT